MSSKARRIPDRKTARPFDWSGKEIGGASELRVAVPARARPMDGLAGLQNQAASVERDAFAKGFAQGERAGFEAGAQRADAMLRRLSQTLDELAGLRSTIIRQTERQMIQLALAIARRIVRREVTLDAELMIALARVALDRLEARTPATVRLNPEDAALAAQSGEAFGAHVKIVADSTMARGGCAIESEFGAIDASVEAQLHEVSRALLGDEAAAAAPVANE
jgi:flagellar assembly protein FliH